MSATCPKYRNPPPRRSGAALVVVLLLLAFFAGLIADFLYNIRVNNYITSNQMQQLQGKYAAEAGINAAKGLLLHSSPFSRGSRAVFQNVLSMPVALVHMANFKFMKIYRNILQPTF